MEPHYKSLLKLGEMQTQHTEETVSPLLSNQTHNQEVEHQKEKTTTTEALYLWLKVQLLK